jgi:hypothetical protein
MSRRLERAEAVWTRSAISIQARSCEDGCIMRPDTRQHLNLRSYPSKTSCFPWGAHTRSFNIAAQVRVLVIRHLRGQPFLESVCSAET